MLSKTIILAAAIGVSALASPAMASTCLGVCSSKAGADGDIAAPPAFGPGYSYVTTANGATGAGQIAGISGGTNGSEFITDTFAAAAGDALNFYFNYITSDGAGFSDYAFAELRTDAGAHVAWLFTARTAASGNTSPGTGLPANDSTLNPTSTAITTGTTFSGLGTSSGTCWSTGCGHTNWINSNYAIGSSGNYQLRLGVTNYSDTGYQSALAFTGVTVAGQQVPTPGAAVPEPATWAMMMLGFGGMGFAMRRRKAAETRIRFA